MTSVEKRITLYDKEIGQVRDELTSCYMEMSGKRAEEESKINLILEEILIHFRHCYGEGTECSICVKKIFSRIKVEVKVIGENRNPLKEDEEEMIYSNSILRRFGIAPSHIYSQKTRTNTVSFLLPQKPKKSNTVVVVLISLVAAVATFFIMKLLPTETQTFISESFVGPIFNKCIAILSTIATPLVFFSVIGGIAGMGSSTAVGKAGAKLIKNMGIIYLLAGILLSVAGVIIYGMSHGASGSGGNVVYELVQLVLDMVPDNMLQSFLDDNALQVVILAIFVGVVLVAIGKRATKVVQGVEVISDVVFGMMGLIVKVLPLIVYLGILQMLLADVSWLGQVYKMIIAWVVCCAAVVLFMIIKVKVVTKAPIGMLFKKQLPTTLINLTTSSQVASLPENMRCCKEKFGIDGRFVDFGLPVLITTYMPCGAMLIGLITWALTDMAGISIGAAMLVKIAFVAVVVAIAAPPIPGSYLTVMAIMFGTCGVPIQYYPIGIVLGTILGYFTPLLNGYLLQLEMLVMGYRLGKVDKEKLRQPIR